MITKKPWILELLVLLLLFGILFAKEVRVLDLRQIDTMMFMEAIANTRDHGIPLSLANKASRDVIPTLFAKDAETLCEADLLPSPGDAKNILENHAYYIVYLLAPMAYLADVKILAPMIHVLIYCVFIWLIYRFLRTKGVGALPSALFCVLVMSHPDWSLGVQGQYYFDRLFIPLAFFIAVVASRLLEAPYKRSSLIFLIFLVALAASIHERAALMIGIFLLSFGFFFRGKIDKRYHFSLVGLAITSIAYAILIALTFTADAEKSNTTTYLIALSSMVKFPAAKTLGDIGVFLLVNIVLLGFFGFWSKRFMTIAVITMLPNILLADDVLITAWLTHYHSYYIPFLVFAAASGFAALSSTQRSRAMGMTLVLVPTAVFVLLVPYYDQLALKPAQAADNAVVSAMKFIVTPENENSQKIFLTYMNKLKQEIPLGSVVSTAEGFFPALYPGRTVLNFPIGLGTADFLVLANKNSSIGPEQYYTAVSLLGPKGQETVDACLNKKIGDLGYDLAHAKKIGYFSVIGKTR